MNTQKLNQLMVNAEGFAFDPQTGDTFNINATGLYILNGLKAAMPRAAILEQLVEHYAVEAQTADRDLEAFIAELQRQKLIHPEEVAS